MNGETGDQFARTRWSTPPGRGAGTAIHPTLVPTTSPGRNTHARPSIRDSSWSATGGSRVTRRGGHGWSSTLTSPILPRGQGMAAAGEVVEPQHPTISSPVSSAGRTTPSAVVPIRRSAPTKIPPGVDMPTALSLVGVTGITAYCGLLDVGRPEPGPTVVVFGAVGGVGSSARSRSSRGRRVVGIAGGARNCDWFLDQLGVDEAPEHRGGDLERCVAHACPEDITSSSTTSAQRPWPPPSRTAPRGRVVLCVAVSSYWGDARPGITHHVNLIVQRCTVQGFLVFAYTDRYGEAVMGLAEWSAAGSRPGQGLPTIPT